MNDKSLSVSQHNINTIVLENEQFAVVNFGKDSSHRRSQATETLRLRLQ